MQARPDSLEHILEYQNQFYYVGGKVPEKECVDKAALYCIGKVNEEAIAKTGAGVPAYITEAFMRTGSYIARSSIRRS